MERDVRGLSLIAILKVVSELTFDHHGCHFDLVTDFRDLAITILQIWFGHVLNATDKHGKVRFHIRSNLADILT